MLGTRGTDQARCTDTDKDGGAFCAQNGTTPATMLVAVNKIGTGMQTFSGTNTYTGDTNINAGALLVTGSTAAGNMIVNAGGTLGGNGDGAVTGLVGALSVNGGTVYQASSRVISPSSPRTA